jgi:hypothetical protein
MDTIEAAIERLTPWDWFVELARTGDGSLLAEVLRGHEKKADAPLPPHVWRFLADVLDGRVKLKRRKKLTAIAKDRRYLKEKMVARMVRFEMRECGRQRDKQLRVGLIRRWSDYYDTTPANVERYLRLSRQRRR